MKKILLPIIFAILSFLVLIYFSKILWDYVPYIENGTDEQNMKIWQIHILAEKYLGFVLLALMSYLTALFLKNNIKHSIIAGISSGLIYQAIAITVYITRFGSNAYLENNRFWSTIIMTLLICFLFSLLAIRKMLKIYKTLNGKQPIQNNEPQS